MKSSDMPRPAVFLDRDGTVNEERDYLHRIEELEFIPGAVSAIASLKAAGYLVVVVTNQSGVARGYFTEDIVHRLHEHMQGELDKAAAGVDGYYLCPHHPTEGVGMFRIDCDCRKGGAGMLLRAANDHGIDLGQSFMVGDKLADIEAGNAAGCRSILVRTGYGDKEEARVVARFPETKICRDLADAADYILSTG